VIFLVLVVEKLLSEDFNVLLDLDEQLDLILLNGTSDFGSCEKSVEDLKDAEHFISIGSLRKFGLQNGSDLRFNPINLSIVGSLGMVPELLPS
jgi:hypothetical protein